MPQVNKQTVSKPTIHRPTSNGTGGVLSRIAPVKQDLGSMMMSLYGRPKCLGKGTPVLMYDGSIKPVEEVEAGDQLMGPDSAPRNVLMSSSGFGKLYKIVPIKGDSWICNDAHILTLTGTCQLMGRVRDVSVTDYLEELATRKPMCKYWRLFRAKVSFQKQSEPLSVPPYLLGLWLGDGHRGGAEITNRKPEVHTYCKDIAASLGLACQITPDKTTYTIAFSAPPDGWQGRPGRNTLRTFLREECSDFGLKKIPKKYLTASRPEREQLLAGIIDTDGKSKNESGTCVMVTGEVYRDGLLFLCRSLGLAAYSGASQTHVCSNGRVSTYYTISISGDLSRLPTLVRKFPPRQQEKRVCVTGFKIVDHGEGHYYGFTLDGDGRFLLGDFTVTHNTGKTRLACTFPKPLLIIGAEDGTGSVIGTKGVDFVQLNRCEEILEIVNGPLAQGKYASAVLDNGSKFRDMRICEILGLQEVAVQKGWGFAGREQWMECSNSMKELIRPLLNLGRRRQLNVVVIAQEQNFGDESGQSSDLITPTIGPALGKSVCDWLNAECDYIGHALIREQTMTQKVKAAGKEIEQVVNTGKKEYCLRVAPHEVYQSGFRIPLGKELKQDFVINPTYEKICKLIKGEIV